ncbi:nucleotide disphospho-sugar-binding domain-containing protein [Actinokineospora soli]|uniref:Nucleotide disphospho-sugar-binding domain-containing protein n=1 Tax=Actinokineospora soli TaxID=1048753 RepID=A0ABW2TMI9_9PSEU
MRVLFCSTAAIGRLFPLVPLAWALRAAGHEVLVTFGQHLDAAAATGLHVIDAAPGYDGSAVFGAIRSNPALTEREFATPEERQHAGFVLMVAEANRPFVDRTVELVDQWRPDLVVYEQTATYGLIAAARRGVPAVQRNLGTFRTDGLHDQTGAHLADEMRRHGVEHLPRPALVLEYVPPSMLPFPEPEGEFVRDLPFTSAGVLGDRLPEPQGRPRIALTTGTVKPPAHRHHALSATLAAAAEVDADFALALGDIDYSVCGPLPANVTPVGWTPLDVLLTTCSGLVHHGGGGSTMAAIVAGVPQLLLLDPRFPSTGTMAAAVEVSGVGLVTAPDDVDAAALTALLADEGLRKATADVRAELDTLPTPADLVPRLVDLTH